MHVDGSYLTTKVPAPSTGLVGGRQKMIRAMGWAVVACFDDRLLESAGGLVEPDGVQAAGHHEHIAFIEGIKFAHQLGVPFKNVSLICDDDIFGYGPTWLHEGNLFGARRDQLLERLSFVIKTFFEPQTESLVMEAFEHARIVKIKGHMLHVHQERADYLAKHQARLTCGLESDQHLPFEQWLQKGFRVYDSATEQYLTQHAPFVQAPGAAPELGALGGGAGTCAADGEGDLDRKRSVRGIRP